MTVACRIDQPPVDAVFRLPSWIPGSYLLREFARHVLRIEARADGEPVAIEKIDKSAWQVGGRHESLTITIVVLANDLSVRGSFLDRRRGFFNGTGVFLFVEGRESDPVTVEIVRPVHQESAAWRVATAMTASAIDAKGFGTYQAVDYDELIDHPFEVSDHARVSFVAADVPHELIVAGAIDTDLERVASDLRQLCETQIEFFGRPAPFERYTFLGLAVGDGYGGLEHRASTALIFNRNDLPRVGETGLPRSYQRFLALCSHEYFHSWHVKRSKPAAFAPYDLKKRNHTRLLWVFEGITTYYQERFLLTSGLLGAEGYLTRLCETLTRVYRVPGRFVQSIAESSFDAWDSLYKPGPSSVNTGVSYYSKGALVALALDLRLRLDSDGSRSLDDVVRALWVRFGKAGIGLPENGFEQLAREFGGEWLDDFFESAVRGTEDPDLASLLQGFGLEFELRPATGPSDLGGPKRVDSEPRLALGVATQARDTGVELRTVFDGGPAAQAGLCVGDVVLAIDAFVVAESTLAARLARYVAGDNVEVHYVRDGLLQSTKLRLDKAPADTCRISIRDDAGEAAQALRMGWLQA